MLEDKTLQALIDIQRHLDSGNTEIVKSTGAVGMYLARLIDEEKAYRKATEKNNDHEQDGN